MRSSTCGSLEAGPSVATILVLRGRSGRDGAWWESIGFFRIVTAPRYGMTERPGKSGRRVNMASSAPRPLLENRDRGQLPAFEKLEEGAAARGDVGDPVRHAVLPDRGDRVAPAGERKRAG